MTHDEGSRVTTDIGPFAIVPAWLLEYDLDGKALRVYIALRSWAGRGDDCFPSREAIADRAGVSIASYKRAMVDLEAAGVVTKSPRYRADGGIAGWTFHLPTIQPEPGGAHQLSRGGLTSRAGGGSPVEPAKEAFELNPPHEPTTTTKQDQEAAGAAPREPAQADLFNDRPPSVLAGVKPPRDSNASTAGQLGGQVKTKVPPDDLEQLFREFWDTYAHKVAVGSARKAWSKATRKADPREIINAAMRYARGRDPRFIAHGATWLNEERWLDEPSYVRNGTTPASDGHSNGYRRHFEDIPDDEYTKPIS